MRWGRFIGRVVTEWIRGERDMVLLEPFVYEAPDGVQWVAPEGSVINGASIPKKLWTIVGAPYTGLYREPSVIHDVYCVTQERTWQDTHLVFYQACRCAGMEHEDANLLYQAVKHFGPKW